MLNTGQTLAYDELSKFMIGTKPKICLTGPGGVGKTFLLAEFVTSALDAYEKMCALMSIPCTIDSVYFTATTNKATEILSESLKNSNLTMNYESISTIHSLLGLKVTNSYSTGKSNLHTTAGTKKIFNALIIIDEVSIANKELTDIIDQYVDMDTCKIIFVGDHAQLPPIREAVSPVFTDPEIEMVHLTEPVRQKADSYLYKVCQELRETALDPNKPVKTIIPDNNEIIRVTKDEAFDVLKNIFGKASPDNKILAYRNDQVKKYNNFLRGYRKLPDTFTPGEIVVNNTAITSKSQNFKMPVEATYEILEDRGLDEFSKDGNDGETHTLTVRKYQIQRLNGNTGPIIVEVPEDMSQYQRGLAALKQRKDWSTFFVFKERFPDLRPTDACTIHKSQGSTYNNVFIDLQDIRVCREASLLKRLLYVAASRAKEKVYVYGSL